MARDRGLAPGPQSRFDRDSFTTTIEQHGLLYRWSRALVCPCMLGTDTDQYDPTCGRCVDGWRYVNPRWLEEAEKSRTYSEITAVFSSITMDPTTHKWVMSPWTTGHGVMTVDGHVPVSFKDRFVSLSQRTTFSQLLRRGSVDIIPVGWLGRSGAVQATSMRYEPLDIHYVEDSAGVTYRRGVDFDLLAATSAEPTRMRWLSGGSSPTADEVFSISYDCHPVWKVGQATFAVQNSKGPAVGLAGANVVQYLPTTFQVSLDWLSSKQGG